LENVELNGNEFEIGLVKVYDKIVNCRRSLFYNTKASLFGAKFADTYLSKSE
jgi:hypothetical protein